MYVFKCVWICVILNKNYIIKIKYNYVVYLLKFLIVMCVVYEFMIFYKVSLKIFVIFFFLFDDFWVFLY